ncbi:MAG: hypothetical protein JSR37_07895 [Verrucomicrobia bacterium]|nr:hypothetical protein [Verrucomicrobiota bacterium]MBS0637939.1 hypothetical protein [Verrucomicrobiota bacterium]
MKKIALVLLSVSFFASCSRETSPDVYDDQNFGAAETTYLGTILEMHEVHVQNGEGLQDNTTGMVGGGVAGALLGSTIGKGDGSVVAAVAGGLLGATGGAALEDHLRKSKAMRYIVQLDNGELKTIVQSIEPRMHPGEKVYVMISNSGRSRIIRK